MFKTTGLFGQIVYSLSCPHAKGKFNSKVADVPHEVLFSLFSGGGGLRKSLSGRC